MTTTVHVSRTFSVDPSNPQVLEELRLLAARGFEVLGPLDLTPVKAVAVEPEPKPEPADPRERVAEILEELKARSNMKGSLVAAMLGVDPSAVYGWRAGSREIPPARLDQLEKLLQRSRSLPEGSTTLSDEATGAAAAAKQFLLAGKRRPKVAVNRLSDDKRLEVAVLREGGATLAEIARKAGVSLSTVHRVLCEFKA